MSERVPASGFDAIIWAAALDDNLGGLVEAVWRSEQASADHPGQLTVDTVFTAQGHPFDLIALRGMRAAERVSRRSAELLRLEDEEGLWVLAAWPSSHDGVYHLVSSVPTTHPRWDRVERWIGSARGVMRCFLNHEDFLAIGNALAECGDVEVGRMTARAVLDGSSISRGWPSVVGSLRPSHLEAIREAEDRLASVRTLTLHVHDVLSVHLRRVAGATYYSGDFAVFENLVLARLAAAAAARRSLMANRERKPLEAARSITVQLSRPLLETAENTALVIDQVERLSRASVAVFHRNPYLHFVVTDEVDGSNFDVMVTRPDAIEIYPGFRASMEAITRIAQELGERFDATEIKETPPAHVSLEDLASA